MISVQIKFQFILKGEKNNFLLKFSFTSFILRIMELLLSKIYKTCLCSISNKYSLRG